MTVITEYRDAVLNDIGAASVSPTGQQSNLGQNAKSQWFALVPRVPGEYVEAALVTIQTTITSGTVTVASVASAVNLDAQVQNVFVSPQANTSPRSYTGSRKAIQEVERLAFGVFASGRSYPGTAIGTINSVTTVTLTSTILVPIGGEAGAIQIQTPAITNAYTPTSGGLTVANTITARTVSGNNPTVVTFKHDVTTSLASGASIDITTFLADPNISADFVDFVASSVTDITGITVIGQDGTFLVDINDGITGTLVDINTFESYANALSATAPASLFFNLRQQGVRKAQMNLATAKAYDLLRMEFANGLSVTPQAGAAPTPAPPAAGQTGRAVAGGVTVVQKGGGGLRPVQPGGGFTGPSRRV